MRAAPRGFCPIGRDGKIFRYRFTGIDVAPVGQGLRPAGEQQVCRFQVAEVFPVYPEQIHRPVTATSCGMFRLDPLHRVGGIGQMNDLQVDGVVRFHLAAYPVEVAVNGLVTAPGVKPDGLPGGLLLNGLPALCGEGRGCQQQTRQKRAKTHPAHNASLFNRRDVTGKQPASDQR